MVVTQPPETLHLCQQPPRALRQEQGHLLHLGHTQGQGSPQFSVRRKNISMEPGSKSWPLPRTAVHLVLNPCHLSGNCIPISLRNPGLLIQPHPLWYCPQSPRLVYSIMSATLVFSLVPQFQREAQPSLSLSGSDLSCRKASSCCLRAGEKKCHWLLARGCYDLFFTEHRMPGRASHSETSARP